MTILLLAGTREARDVARGLAARGLPAIASLAGATRSPAPLPVRTRIGGFGGAKAFASFLAAERIGAIVDATHPFAARISARSHAVATELGLPYLQVLRPGWRATEGDRWTWIDTEADAERHIPLGATVFLATGRQTLPAFAGLAEGRRLLCRQIDPPEAPFPYANGDFVVGQPPFPVEDEVALFRRLGVDWLVVKDAGGVSETKLIAARRLGLPVAMIARPPQPDGPRVATAEEALAWLTTRA
ncbi:MAG: cobalt-precorrin-6A reductase [Shimia sp.]